MFFGFGTESNSKILKKTEIRTKSDFLTFVDLRIRSQYFCILLSSDLLQVGNAVRSQKGAVMQ